MAHIDDIADVASLTTVSDGFGNFVEGLWLLSSRDAAATNLTRRKARAAFSAMGILYYDCSGRCREQQFSWPLVSQAGWFWRSDFADRISISRDLARFGRIFIMLAAVIGPAPRGRWVGCDGLIMRRTPMAGHGIWGVGDA